MKDANKLNIRDVDGGAVMSVKVVVSSSRNRIVGLLGDSLKVAVSAAPERGKANAAVTKTLAKALGVDSQHVGLVSGRARRRKEFQIIGQTAEQVRDLIRSI